MSVKRVGFGQQFHRAKLVEIKNQNLKKKNSNVRFYVYDEFPNFQTKMKRNENDGTLGQFSIGK